LCLCILLCPSNIADEFVRQGIVIENMTWYSIVAENWGSWRFLLYYVKKMTDAVLVTFPSPGWDFRQRNLSLTYVVKNCWTIGSGRNMKETFLWGITLSNKVKVKQSRNRPGVAQRFPGGLGSQISWHSAHGGGEVVSLMHPPSLPPGMFLALISTRAMVRSEGICHWKIQWHHRE